MHNTLLFFLGLVDKVALFLTCLSPFFVVVHNLLVSINLTQRNVTCLSVYHKALFWDPYFICYILLLFSDVIANRQLNYHLYADDTQLYLAFKTNYMNLAIDCVVSCVSEISCWMEQNDLKLNPDKTDILLIYSRFREGPALDYLQFRDERISISDKIRSLRIIFDKHMTFDHQIDHVCKSSIKHLRNFCLEFVHILKWMLPRRVHMHL